MGTACLLALGSIAAHAAAGSLRARHAELKPQLQGNSYGRQMFIDSAEGSNSLQGDVYAVLDHPFDKVKEALVDPAPGATSCCCPSTPRRVPPRATA